MNGMAQNPSLAKQLEEGMDLLIEDLFFVFLLFVVSFHHVLGKKLWIDWGNPHKLIKGWKGISLTPILGVSLAPLLSNA